MSDDGEPYEQFTVKLELEEWEAGLRKGILKQSSTEMYSLFWFAFSKKQEHIQYIFMTVQ